MLLDGINTLLLKVCSVALNNNYSSTWSPWKKNRLIWEDLQVALQALIDKYYDSLSRNVVPKEPYVDYINLHKCPLTCKSSDISDDKKCKQKLVWKHILYLETLKSLLTVTQVQLAESLFIKGYFIGFAEQRNFSVHDSQSCKIFHSSLLWHGGRCWLLENPWQIRISDLQENTNVIYWILI